MRDGLTALGHDVSAVGPRTGTFGYGQAVMSDGAGVHYGASEPRHDGAAIPEAPPVFRRDSVAVASEVAKSVKVSGKAAPPSGRGQ